MTDLVPQALEVLERAMLGRPGYGSLHILKTEIAQLRTQQAAALAVVDAHTRGSTSTIIGVCAEVRKALGGAP